ncbi:class I SAM-dependent methyltransferase [Aureimonas altamirensis]|uniref:class I SAM-dependent methyltransferase n=1 Tax=Aureimonas altamirensis TaxID=370622 RepID=UPI0020370B04|nr:class I SAM-dependent methyltransferase [Aureimonas altamirensis]MCM2505780.1 class I SAM-dependent methyltransferase [Aureimonas altamirensis]
MGEIFERTVPDIPLEWTGERLTSAVAGQVEIEHLHRYFLARGLSRNKDVLDIACGEGYGSALIAQVARSVIGVDVSSDAVEHASRAYPRENLRFTQGDARQIPIPDSSVDLLVSFETLEHFLEHELFMMEALRVMRPGGVLLLSSPERDIYSPPGSEANPYHANELSRIEFTRLLEQHFTNIQIVSQRPIIGSAVVVDEGVDVVGTLTFEKRGARHYEVSSGLPRPPYLLALASNEALPAARNSLFIETDQVHQLAVLHQLQDENVRQAAAVKSLQEENARYAEQMKIYERQAKKAEGHRLEIERDLALAKVTRSSEVSECESPEESAISLNNADTLRAENEVLRAQCDLLRRAARTRLGSSGSTQTYSHSRLELAEAQAAEWKQRYEALHERLVAILRRFGVLYVAQITPKSAKRFVRERILAGKRP